MPSKIRKKVVGIPFTVNDTPYRTRAGCHEVKSRYGRRALLLRLHPKHESSSPSSSPSLTSPASSRSTALVAKKMAKRLKRCTICAVDARGRFLVEEGGAYVLGAMRSEEAMTDICNAERGVFEAKKTRKPQLHPAKSRRPNTYTKFLGAFLIAFQAVSVSDGSAAWRSFSSKEKKEKSVEALIESVKDMGLYPGRTAPA